MPATGGLSRRDAALAAIADGPHSIATKRIAELRSQDGEERQSPPQARHLVTVRSRVY
jgi:hypothetical protein